MYIRTSIREEVKLLSPLLETNFVPTTSPLVARQNSLSSTASLLRHYEKAEQILPLKLAPTVQGTRKETFFSFCRRGRERLKNS